MRLEGVAAGKHYAVLTLAADIVRELHGARLTCCKVCGVCRLGAGASVCAWRASV